ncbi:hypothetical protein GCM10010512_41640 [Streptomyces thermoviolaceus subsp. thermoviolaceus]|uniref:Protein kinase domain-containing protein n=1 Tax=Streptomyces thermoviolaceus subsp. thermoviolaceus TaxID=66860 RepID=A0ABX0YT96_STRTL|nr:MULTISPECIES: hypothetical protein [Streptomyces]NJP15564.1 hypothetical protein [Streptomyces thermoviolaceus subsp. thermoviolaceus]RSS05070.1 hypothetical protein EF917_10885 [Streptomyces sp. WAC00469]GHB05897.1 hypothetical protein GCM10010512_41640 [Streptomyces thermoviolaceus subsp. thermoviolaceus]
MTHTEVTRIGHADLTLGRELGKGGQGTVREIERLRINGSWPVAYKEYTPEALRQLRTDVLERMVAFLPAQPAAVGEWLARNTAWPAALVTRGADVSGFLMRQIPDEFFLTMPSGDRKTAGFEFLLNELSYVRRIVGEVSPRQTMGLLLALAGTLHRLHGLGVVAGDLSPKNLLFSLSGAEPGCFLIDCDAMGVGGDWALKPVQTPDWELPSGEALGTPQGDVYKFALLAVRLFLHAQQGKDVEALRRADRAVGDLAERTLCAPAAGRPALGEWLEPLRRACATAPVTWPATAPRPGAAAPQSGRPAAGANRPGAPAGAGTAHVPPPAPKPPSRARSTAAVLAVIALVIVVLAWRAHDRDDSDGGYDGSTDGSSYSSTVENDTTNGTTNDTTTDDTSTSDSVTPEDTRADQVAELGRLLADNAGRRDDVADAVRSMTRCTGLSSAREVFVEAAATRTYLVTRLDSLSDSALPVGLTSVLRTAWDSSADADRAYARVVDEVAGDCSGSAVVHSAAWQDADEASAEATRAKQEFVARWNPLAEEYGERTLEWTDL